jgi:hypothetical protein
MTRVYCINYDLKVVMTLCTRYGAACGCPCWGALGLVVPVTSGSGQVVATAPNRSPMSKQLRKCCAWCKAVRPNLSA